jgi:hypothetical protein
MKSNLVADFRLGYTKHHANRDNFAFDTAFSGSDDPMAALGARNTTTPQDGARLYLPSVGIGNAGGGFGSGLFGHEGWLGLFDQPSFHFGGTVSWVKSSHNVKAGGDGIRLGQRYAVTGGQNGPQLNFDGRFSSLGTGRTTSPTAWPTCSWPHHRVLPGRRGTTRSTTGTTTSSSRTIGRSRLA